MQTIIEDPHFYYVYSVDLNNRINTDLFEEENPIYYSCIKMKLQLVSYFIKQNKKTFEQTSNYIYYDPFHDDFVVLVVDNANKCYWFEF